MHFDPRTQSALREQGLDGDALRDASEAVAEALAADAETCAAFVDDHERLYSDMELAHSDETYPEHRVEYLDYYTHGASLSGWLRFDSWGVGVEDCRVLEAGLIELSLSGSVGDRVRFAAERERLR